MSVPELPMTIVDESAFQIGQGKYRCQKVFRMGDRFAVRVRIERSSYLEQSYAVVEVLNADVKWTQLAEEPGSSWHADSERDYAGSIELMDEIMYRLAGRAAAILAATA